MPDVFCALELIAEKRIRKALEAGKLTNLPGEGQPLELEDLSHVPEELRMAYKILKNAGCVPEEIQLRKEIISLTELMANCQDEKENIRASQKLRWLLDRVNISGKRHAALEANEEYYQKALTALARSKKARQS